VVAHSAPLSSLACISPVASLFCLISAVHGFKAVCKHTLKALSITPYTRVLLATLALWFLSEETLLQPQEN
jgi:hypothetical protein